MSNTLAFRRLMRLMVAWSECLGICIYHHV